MRALSKIAIAWLAALVPLSAKAQSWPERSVKVVIPFAAGGPTDAVARIVSDKLSKRWMQPVVIESRPGSGSNIGTAAVARSVPDGYTLLVTTNAVVVNQTLFKRPGYDLKKDLAPIINVARAPNVVIATKSLKAATLREAIEEARGAKFSYGSPGSGTTPHLTMEYLFKVLAKVDVVHVPFKGAGEMNTAALSGVIQFASAGVPAVLPIIASGDVRGLIVTSTKRVAALPDVPTMTEAGVEGLGEDYIWVGFFAPGGTPPALVARLNADVAAVLGLAEVREKLDKIGFEIVGGSPDEFAQYVAVEVGRWAAVAKAIRHAADVSRPLPPIRETLLASTRLQVFHGHHTRTRSKHPNCHTPHDASALPA
jgi:tripartite-type tricarboxylate transporter receptor subunit TctC